MAQRARQDGRRANELRMVRVTPGFVRTADGSCLFEMGGTRLICTASLVNRVEDWRKGSNMGWVTAEYSMLPASTGARKARRRVTPDGRSVEIQRQIGRALRSVVRFDRLGENTMVMDCDVLEADGGTRTAAVNGAYVALVLACQRCAAEGRIRPGVVRGAVAAVSVGRVGGREVLDMTYLEDSAAEVDLNVAMTSSGQFVEVQGTAEREPFNQAQLARMLSLARRGIRKLLSLQRQAIREGQRR